LREKHALSSHEPKSAKCDGLLLCNLTANIAIAYLHFPASSLRIRSVARWYSFLLSQLVLLAVVDVVRFEIESAGTIVGAEQSDDESESSESSMSKDKSTTGHKCH